MGMIQTIAVVVNYSLNDLLRPLGITITGDNLLTAMRASAQTAPVAVNTAVANFLSFTLRGTGNNIAITVVNVDSKPVERASLEGGQIFVIIVDLAVTRVV